MQYLSALNIYSVIIDFKYFFLPYLLVHFIQYPPQFASSRTLAILSFTGTDSQVSSPGIPEIGSG